ncbi:hypothetical protein BD309DRAFT_631896 [Dichomitus squalens]|uniref:Uncharacterized protein n=1 Tax=Dichomitus squalens TaxID=114155 RepID=A0A4Q9N916_9APHY|nr:hypothetical protein BD309DRAFT_631896 [Dichomitus squalens]TBU53894.1 hypothetical protein BD310DRAFT_114189 [Dichomitus squalens]
MLYPTSQKIRNVCAQARVDGFRWLWTDTCCIDKTNSVELSEAMASMYRWYECASNCYALLDDVPSVEVEDPRHPTSSFRRSRWHRRGWTLQELIAPCSVIFLSKGWKVIGNKHTLADLIEEVTGIDRYVLTHERRVEDCSVACRMSWAAGRETRRVEDEAYCLMGIFGVYMPILYGEGRNAFLRLQEEIVKKTSDQSIFAWGTILDDYRLGAGAIPASAKERDSVPQSTSETLLASSPADFAGCAGISPISQQSFYERIGITATFPSPYTRSCHGIRTKFPLISIAHTSSGFATLALLACQDKQGRIIALFLRPPSCPTTSNTSHVGGYIAEAGHRTQYYRGTRIFISERSGLAIAAKLCLPFGKYARLLARPEVKKMYVHSHDTIPRIGTPNTAATSSSPSRTSMISFECCYTSVCSSRSSERSRRVDCVLPEITEKCLRLDVLGDSEMISFLGDESFTVYVGACSPDVLSPDPPQKAMFPATFPFDSELIPFFKMCRRLARRRTKENGMSSPRSQCACNGARTGDVRSPR